MFKKIVMAFALTLAAVVPVSTANAADSGFAIQLPACWNCPSN